MANCDRFSSASLIKIPLLLAWLILERQGAVNRFEMCDLDAEPQVKGAGFSWKMYARRLPFHDVLLMMIATSDNLCTNLVIRRIGLERAQAVFAEMGLVGTRLERRLMDLEARSKGRDNWITAKDCLQWYEIIRSLAPEERGWVDELLESCEDDGLLKHCLTRDSVTFFHKTGSLPGVLHDWGYTREKELFLLTQNFRDELAVSEAFGEIGKLLANES